LQQLKALAQDGTMQIGSINAQLAQAVASIKAPAAATGAAAAGGSDFVSSLDAALKNVSRNQQTSSELQRQFQLENPNVSLEQTMIAMNQSSLSFQAAVQVRNRLVQAYEQIMQMPV
jgi:flagellar hook-basal body complex protein FliE